VQPPTARISCASLRHHFLARCASFRHQVRVHLGLPVGFQDGRALCRITAFLLDVSLHLLDVCTLSWTQRTHVATATRTSGLFSVDSRKFFTRNFLIARAPRRQTQTSPLPKENPYATCFLLSGVCQQQQEYAQLRRPASYLDSEGTL
jgi:hypothetical protein